MQVSAELCTLRRLSGGLFLCLLQLLVSFSGCQHTLCLPSLSFVFTWPSSLLGVTCFLSLIRMLIIGLRATRKYRVISSEGPYFNSICEYFLLPNMVPFIGSQSQNRPPLNQLHQTFLQLHPGNDSLCVNRQIERLRTIPLSGMEQEKKHKSWPQAQRILDFCFSQDSIPVRSKFQFVT